MPIKGDNLDQATALSSVDHHGVDVLIADATEPVRAIIYRGIELIDAESGLSTYGDLVEMLWADLPAHTHGTVLTVVATGEVLRLQKTLKDDGVIKQIEVTR